MTVLDDNTKNEIKKRLGEMETEVTLVYFDKKTEVNEHIKSLLTELSGLSDKIKLEVHDIGSEEAKKHGVDDGPVTLFKSKHVKGDARFYGLPAGHEFATILEVIRLHAALRDDPECLDSVRTVRLANVRVVVPPVLSSLLDDCLLVAFDTSSAVRIDDNETGRRILLAHLQEGIAVFRTAAAVKLFERLIRIVRFDLGHRSVAVVDHDMRFPRVQAFELGVDQPQLIRPHRA